MGCFKVDIVHFSFMCLFGWDSEGKNNLSYNIYEHIEKPQQALRFLLLARGKQPLQRDVQSTPMGGLFFALYIQTHKHMGIRHN